MQVLALQILVMLGLPVGIGMAVRRRFPGFAFSHRSAVQRAGFLALALFILLVMYSQWADFARGARGTIGLAAVSVGLSFSVGWIVALAVRCDARDRFTLSAEFATRNVAVAAGIAVTILGRIDFAVFAATYMLTEAPLLVTAALLFRAVRRSEPAYAAPFVRGARFEWHVPRRGALPPKKTPDAIVRRRRAQIFPAATYSPMESPPQYHRR